MDTIYRRLLEQGWKLHEIDETDIYELVRLMNKEEETGPADKNDKSAFNFLP